MRFSSKRPLPARRGCGGWKHAVGLRSRAEWPAPPPPPILLPPGTRDCQNALARLEEGTVLEEGGTCPLGE